MSYTRSARSGRWSLLVAAGLLATGLAAGPASAQKDGGLGPQVFGFSPDSLGQAHLSVETDATGKKKLKISNLGSSGCDGFSVAPPGGTDLLAIGIEEIEFGPINCEIVLIDIYATIAGGPEQKMGTLRMEAFKVPGEGQFWHTSADFSAMGAQTCTLVGYDEGTRVFEMSGLTPDLGYTTKAAAEVVCLVSDGTGDFPKGEVIYTFLGPVIVVTPAVNIGGGGPGAGTEVSATSFEFVPDITAQVDQITKIEMYTQQTPAVTLDALQAGIAGVLATGLDETQIENQGGKLKISNLGSSGCDGVSVAPGGGGPGEATDASSLVLDDYNGGNPLGAGSSFSMSLDVVRDGWPHEGLAKLTATHLQPGTPDRLVFEVGGGLDWKVEGMLAGAVAVTADPLNDQFMLDCFFDVCNVLDWQTLGAGSNDPGAKCLSVAFPQQTTLEVNGIGHAIDELRLTLGSGDAWTVTDVLGWDLESVGMSDFTLTDGDDTPSPFENLGKLSHKHHGHVTVLKGPLSGGGPLEAGTLGGLMLDDGPPSAPGALFIGLAAAPTPFKAGELVPVPILLQIDLFTSANGEVDLPFLWPAGMPAGLELYFQWAVADAAAIQGVWLSNAMRATVP